MSCVIIVEKVDQTVKNVRRMCVVRHTMDLNKYK